jgi:UDP-N-acetylglucosamine--N-acetylmuramyl-(pentapeptide) pyrophosphoryl-undecaprenol N-acetylglucosamine transferase
VVLVTGGSQGARGLNDLILRALPLVARTAPDWQWLHLTGAADVERVRAGYAEHKLAAIVQPFSTQMEIALGAADAAVTRAGASSLAELAAMQLPAVLVPLPASADDHQRFNAKAFSADGAARWVEQTTATPEELVKHLQELIGNEPVRAMLRAALVRRHAPGAAAEIATQVLASLVERTVDSPTAVRMEVVA